MSKGSNTTTTSTTPDPVAMATYYNMLGRAQGVASTPYEAFTGEEVAPINAQQTAGIGQINQNAGFAKPYAEQGLGNIAQGSGAVTPEDIARYYDPYTGQVINATQADFDVQNQRANSIVTGNAAAQGALGGDRVGVAQALTQEGQQRVQAPIIAGLRSSGFRSAEEMANAQKARQLAGGAGEVSSATGAQSAALQGAGAMFGAGTLQQQTQQAADTQARLDYYQKQGYPFAVAQWLAGIDTGVGSQLGGKGTTTGPAPNIFAQLAGVGLAGAGMFAKAADGGRIKGLASGGLANPWGEAGQGWVPTIGLTPGKGAPPPPNAPKETNPFTKDSAKGLASLGKKATDWWNDSASSPLTDYNPTQDFSNANFGVGPELPNFYMMNGGVARGYDVGGTPTSVGVGSFVDDDMPSDIVAQRFPKELMARHISPADQRLREVGQQHLQEPTGQLYEPSGMAPRPVATETIRPDEPAPVAQQDVIPQARAAFRGVAEEPEPDVMSYAPRGVRAAPRGVAAQQSDFPEPTPEPSEASAFGGLGNVLGKLSPEAKQGLISMGLGMMANRVGGPGSFLAAMGEGGQQGMTTYASAKAATAQRALEQQKLEEARLRHMTMTPYQKATLERENLQFVGQNEDGYPVYIDKRTGKETIGANKLQAKAPAGYVRNPDGSMSAIKGGPSDPEIVAGLVKAKSGAQIPDATADFLAERVINGDAKALVGLGRGAQGAENIIRVQTLVAQKAAERGLNAKDILAGIAEQSGLTASQRTFGTQIARMAINSTEAEGAIHQGLEVSKQVARTKFVPINKLIQMAEGNISDPDLLEFRAANLAIINTYARAISPTGVPTVHDKEEAMKIVSEATSPEAYERVMRRMLKEIAIAHAAPLKAKQELERIRKSSSSSEPVTPAVIAPEVPAKPGSTPKRVRQNGHTYEQQTDGSYKAID